MSARLRAARGVLSLLRTERLWKWRIAGIIILEKNEGGAGMEFRTHSPEETHALGKRIGGKIRGGIALCLQGDLGAGKTALAQGIVAALRSADEVTSPTFTVMNVYAGDLPIYHFDLYRMEQAEELEDIGFEEYAAAPDAVVLIEWADKFPAAAPENCLWLRIARGEEMNERCVSVELRGERYRDFYEELGQA